MAMPLRVHWHAGAGSPLTWAEKPAVKPSGTPMLTGGITITGAPGGGTTTRPAAGLVALPASLLTVTL